MKHSAYVAARGGAVAVGLALIGVALYVGFIALMITAGHQGAPPASAAEWVWRIALLGIPVAIAALGVTFLMYRGHKDWRRPAIVLAALAIDVVLLVIATAYVEQGGDRRTVDNPCAGLPASACSRVPPQPDS